MNVETYRIIVINKLCNCYLEVLSSHLQSITILFVILCLHNPTNLVEISPFFPAIDNQRSVRTIKSNCKKLEKMQHLGRVKRMR